jgi:aromatic-L-amino-acid decarboxylase
MTPQEFRRAGYEVVDWIADYLAGLRQHPVLPDVSPGDLVSRLPASAPERGEGFEAIFNDFRDQVIPTVNHWNHPRFMAYFSVSASAPGILAEMLAAALNTNGMLWKSNPASAELEQVTLDWLRQWLGLPPEFFGIIFDTASVSTMHAIAAAREMADPEVRRVGGSRDLVLYTSEQAHSSVEKGAIAVGIGQENVRKIAVDEAFRMRLDALTDCLAHDRRSGRRPFCIVATVGTTSTTSVDPVAEIATIAREQGVWLHIDAAYAGAAAILPEHRHILAGAEHADSLVINPHKWLFTPIDLSAFYTRRPEVLRRAFSLIPEYLRTAEDARAINYMDYGVPLGRRFRALKLWFVLRHFGREGVIQVIRDHIGWAQELAAKISGHPCLELAAPTPFSLVCFRHKGGDDPSRRLLDLINSTRSVFLSHTVLNGRFTIRVAIGNIKTTRDDVFAVWKLIQDKIAES